MRKKETEAKEERKVIMEVAGDRTVLRGLRRELNKELFEELAALQCAPEEILGYVGTTLSRLRSWCRMVYGKPLPAMLDMIRKDGLIAIRRASFDQLKKSATIISQQYNRFLPNAGTDPLSGAESAIKALTSALTPGEKDMRELFGEEKGEEE